MGLRFSQRMGLTPATKQIQIASMDDHLRNGLWDTFKAHVIDVTSKHKEYSTQRYSTFQTLCTLLWHHFYKRPTDKIPPNAETFIRMEFFECEWFEVYDLLEFTLSLDGFRIKFPEYIDKCNQIFEREFSGFRFIDGVIAPIINAHEVNEVQYALDQTATLTALHLANVHLKSALSHLSNKTHPDYRNSIKESISAVESIAKVISGNAKDTLGAALDKIKGQIKIHTALEKGFKQLYGYTSDSGGIRHALKESPDCDFEDAKYMLVSCSAFINYLTVKAEKAGIVFEK